MSAAVPRMSGEPGEPPQEMTTLYLGLLRKGPGWSPEASEQVVQDQRDHLALLSRLVNSGRLLIAGPIRQGEDLRGIVVFQAASLEDARGLMAKDPHLTSGRLVLDLFPWAVPTGLLHQPLLK